MKHLLLFSLFLIANMSFGQIYHESVFNSYTQAIDASKKQGKPIFVYLDKQPDEFIEELRLNDTLTTVLEKEFINLLVPSNKAKRYLKKRYDAKESSILILNEDETLFTKVDERRLNGLVNTLEPLSPNTLVYYSKEYREEFNQTDSTMIIEAIQNAYEASSSENARQLTISYLKNQKSLLSPINYQLMKSLRPVDDKELLTDFLGQMRPELYTREMAEKVAYDILVVNNSDVDETKKVFSQYDIPFKEEVDLYLTLYNSKSFKERKENCYEYVYEGTTFDYESLSQCFIYVIRNGTQKQIKALEQKYLYTFNEVSLSRSLLFADLLGELYLNEGNYERFVILKQRNENVRKKFLKQEN